MIRRRRWTKEEEQALLVFAASPNGKTVKEFSKELGRSEKAVYSKHNKMRRKDSELPFIRNYTTEEVDYLNSFSGDPDGDSIKDVAEYFGRRYNGIGSKLVRLREESNHTRYLKRRWSKHEDNALKQSHGIVSNKELAELLGRSEQSITYRARALGLTKKSTDFTEKGNEIKQLAQEGYTRTQIAEKVNIDYTAVHNYIYRNNIDCKKENGTRTEQQKNAHREFLSHAFGRY